MLNAGIIFTITKEVDRKLLLMYLSSLCLLLKIMIENISCHSFFHSPIIRMLPAMMLTQPVTVKFWINLIPLLTPSGLCNLLCAGKNRQIT